MPGVAETRIVPPFASATRTTPPTVIASATWELLLELDFTAFTLASGVGGGTRFISDGWEFTNRSDTGAGNTWSVGGGSGLVGDDATAACSLMLGGGVGGTNTLDLSGEQLVFIGLSVVETVAWVGQGGVETGGDDPATTGFNEAWTILRTSALQYTAQRWTVGASANVYAVGLPAATQNVGRGMLLTRTGTSLAYVDSGTIIGATDIPNPADASWIFDSPGSVGINVANWSYTGGVDDHLMNWHGGNVAYEILGVKFWRVNLGGNIKT